MSPGPSRFPSLELLSTRSEDKICSELVKSHDVSKDGVYNYDQISKFWKNPLKQGPRVLPVSSGISGFLVVGKGKDGPFPSTATRDKVALVAGPIRSGEKDGKHRTVVECRPVTWRGILNWA
ncbi:hypothetical protein J6590_014098 [Homalodisca vitripennis]|nr:hypothetical protein J6590_014098 [Homalodisca vitripennis]